MISRMRIPFLCLCFFAVLYIGFFVELSFVWLPLCLLALGCLFYCLRFLLKKRMLPPFLSLICGVLAAAVLISNHYTQRYIPSLTGHTDETTFVTATCEEVLQDLSYYGCYRVRVKELFGHKDVSVLFVTEYAGALYPCDRFSAVVKVVALEDVAYFEGQEERWRGDGIHLALTPLEDTYHFTLERKIDGVRALFLRVNEGLETVLRRFLYGDEADLTAALLLGNREGLSRQISYRFNRLGITHLLAVSGMHLTLISGGLGRLLKYLGLSRRARTALCVPVALLFVGITGFSSSVLRAGAMLAFAALVGCLRVRPRPVDALFLSCSVLVAFRPHLVLDVALQLSFLSTLGILVAAPSIARMAGWLRRRLVLGRDMLCAAFGRICIAVVESLCVSVAASVFILPAAWLYFGEVSLVSALFTLVCLPLTNLIIFAAIGVVVLTPLNPVLPLAKLCALAAEGLAALTLQVTEWGALLPDPVRSLRYPFVPVLFVLALAVMLVLLLCRVRYPWSLVIPVVSCSLLFFLLAGITDRAVANAPTAVYLNEKKNEAFLIVSGERTVLCDLSTGSHAMAYRGSEIASTRFYRTDIDSWVLTHYHQRHIDTFSYLSDMGRLRYLYLPEPENNTERDIAQTLAERAAERGCRVIWFEREAGFSVEETRISVPLYGYLGRSSHPYLSLRIEGEEDGVLYIGASALEKEAVPAGGTLLLGVHGPIMKKEAAVDADAVYIASSDLSVFYKVTGEERLIEDCYAFLVD